MNNTESMDKVYLSIGTNIGNKIKNLQDACKKIDKNLGQIVDISGVYETEPWGFDSQNAFYNLIVKIETKFKANDLLLNILKIEKELGRERTKTQYCDRIIDIDIIFFGKQIIDNEKLQVPHPRMQERNFVLKPLNSISPNFIHPVLKLTVNQLLKNCNDKSKIKLVLKKADFNYK